MEYVVDLLLLCVFVLIVGLGAYKGFVKTALTMLSFLLSLFIAGLLSSAAAPVLYDNFVEKPALELVTKRIDQTVDVDLTAKQARQIISDLPDAIAPLAEAVGVDLKELEKSIDSKKVSSESIAQQLTQAVIEPIAIPVLKAISFILLLILCSVILRIVVELIDKFAKLPVLKTANHILGGALGAVKGLLFLLVLCTALHLATSISSTSLFTKAVDSSVIVRYLDISKTIGGGADTK